MADSTPRVSDKFNSRDAEILFQSSDGIQFRIHRVNLSVCSEGFSPPDHATFDDVVVLSESSSTLELLFQFIYPEPQPDLERVEFNVLALLAEAAEKYQVYSAINTCTIHLIKRLPEHAPDVLLHALKHGKRALLGRAAPLLLDCPLEDILALLPHDHIISWVKYHMQWSNVWKSLMSDEEAKNIPRQTCNNCQRLPHEYVIALTDKLSTKPGVLRDLDSIFAPICTSCSSLSVLGAWKAALTKRVSQLPSTTDIFFPADSKFPKEQTASDQLPWVNEGQRITIYGLKTDLVFKSSDGAIFHVHQRNVKTSARNLQIPAEYDCLSLIPLPEASSTLKVLFSFIYPLPHPDLESSDFVDLELVAAAAEKYAINPAIAIADIRLRDALPHNLTKNPHVVMRYAVRTKNAALVDQVAPLLISGSLYDTAKIFEPEMVLAWLDYYERWRAIAKNAVEFASSTSRHVSTRSRPFSKIAGSKSIIYQGCNGCFDPDNLTGPILGKLGAGIQSLQDLDDTFNVKSYCCEISKADLLSWRQSIEDAIRNLPMVSTLRESVAR